MGEAARTPKDRGSELERWAAVLVRSLHLAGVVWLGAYVVFDRPGAHAPSMLMLASGLVMLGMDLRAGRIALGEIAGGFQLVKLGLVGWVAFDPSQARWVFWTLLVASSVVSHAPKGFRHWPTRKPAGRNAPQALRPAADAPRDTPPSRG